MVPYINNRGGTECQPRISLLKVSATNLENYNCFSPCLHVALNFALLAAWMPSRRGDHSAILQLASALRSKSWKTAACVAVDRHFIRPPYQRTFVHLTERKKPTFHSYIKWCLYSFLGLNFSALWQAVTFCSLY